MRCAVRICLLVCNLAACVVIGGGHWTALQTAAWARMAVGYTLENGSLRQGLSETFDGAHPCELCRRIAAGVEIERRDERQKPAKEEKAGKIKLTAVLPAAARTMFSPAVVSAVTMAAVLIGRLSDAPPTPPPRVA